ncbi:MAG TPA: VTT domain-containing protein [Acidobacteriota bacterium]|nr:VTT domain-containing protein [Acidobacteriota bacterium]
MSDQRRRLILRGSIFIVLVALLFFFSRYIPRPFSAFAPPGEDLDDFEGIYSSSDKLSKFLQNLGPYSPAVFVLLQFLQVVAAPFPGELTGVAGGYVYGETFGFLLSTVGLSLGSWVAFELANILGRPFVERFVKRDVLERFNFLTTNTGVAICFVLFLFPGFPKDYLCYVLGLSRMKLSTFLLVSIIGRLPGTYLLTMQGATIRSEQYSTFVIFSLVSVGILAVAYIYRNQLFDWVKRRHEQK